VQKKLAAANISGEQRDREKLAHFPTFSSSSGKFKDRPAKKGLKAKHLDKADAKA
jgi:hypothetical protein